MSDGCTSGAKIVGDRCYLLKNRDLIWSDFRDTIVFEKDVFFIAGVNMKDGDFTGASLGFNSQGLAACNTAVHVTENHADDLILERILRETRSIQDAFELVQSDLEHGNRYHWCNFILASPQGVGAIEIGDGVAVLEEDPLIITRTNHHLLLPTTDIVRRISVSEITKEGLDGSRKRRQDAARLLSDATSMMDMIQLLSNHSESRGLDSICRHLPKKRSSDTYNSQTVYSYVVEISGLQSNKLEFRLNVTPGNPCSGTYSEFVIDFDSPKSKFAVLKDYP